MKKGRKYMKMFFLENVGYVIFLKKAYIKDSLNKIKKPVSNKHRHVQSI